MPAPSPMTKPSRWASKGRLALVGSSLWPESAFKLAKLAMPRGVMTDSVPPASMTSASPCCSRRNASPMAWEPEAQAVTAQTLGPLAPMAIATLPEAMFGIIKGTVKGLTRSGPLVASTWFCSSITPSAPMPEPM
ncbi:hypothetical protein D3C72_808050 [compost metagenome]